LLPKWLDLPERPWPPDYYALIGLDRGAGLPDEIESRVLERLEKLRRYQLQHPEEATEGMNLLAKALDCLGDPTTRADYDRSLGLKVVAKKPEETASAAIPLLPAAIAIDLPDDVEILPLVDDDNEIIEDAIVVGQLVDVVSRSPPPLPETKPQPPPLPEKPKRPNARRREIYFELARVRKVLRILNRLRPSMSDPDRTFGNRLETLAFLGGLAELRPMLTEVRDLVGQPGQPGDVVAALVKQRMITDTFRHLLASQRESLVKDFRSMHFTLSEYYDDLRIQARRRHQRDFVRMIVNPVKKWMWKYPEIDFAAIGLVCLGVAVLRYKYGR
jgi:hypothetical protein